MTASDTTPKIGALTAEQAEQAAEFWPWTSRSQSPRTVIALARARGTTSSQAFVSWSTTTTRGRERRGTIGQPSRGRLPRARLAGGRIRVLDAASGSSPSSPPGPRSRRRHAGARSGPRRRRGAPSAGRAVRRARPRRARRRGSRGDRREIRLDRPARRRPTARSGRRARAPASLRRSWIARWSSRASPSARSSGVSSCRSRRRGPRRARRPCPGRGVARISTSSAASVTPASVTEPSGWNSTAPSRAAAMTAGIAAPSRLPIFGRSGLTRRSTSSDSSPISSTP